jgi:hypothetical protein
LNNLFTPIAEAGPNQQGFSGPELAALNTQVGEGVGQNYAKASQALNTQLSAQGGGNEYLPSGASAALKSNLASAAANQQSQEQLGVTEANYAQGRQNWQQATGGLNALAQEYNPTAIAGATNTASQNAFGQASQIQQMKNQEESEIAGGIMSLGTGFLTGGLSNLASGGAQAGSETGGGLEQFFSGGLSSLAGQ